MSVGKLIGMLEGVDRLAVRLDSITDAVKQLGIQDEILFHPVDIDEQKLRGAFRLSTWRAGVYGEPVYHADIMYGRGQPEEWRRLVCVKELMHLFDSDPHKAASEDHIDRLISRMARPPELRTIDMLKEGRHEFNDRAAVLPALALLFPMAARNILLPEYKADRKQDHEIAAAAVIPERYVEFLMSEAWDEVYPALKSIDEPVAEARCRS